MTEPSASTPAGPAAAATGRPGEPPRGARPAGPAQSDPGPDTPDRATPDRPRSAIDPTSTGNAGSDPLSATEPWHVDGSGPVPTANGRGASPLAQGRRAHRWARPGAIRCSG